MIWLVWRCLLHIRSQPHVTAHVRQHRSYVLHFLHASRFRDSFLRFFKPPNRPIWFSPVFTHSYQEFPVVSNESIHVAAILSTIESFGFSVTFQCGDNLPIQGSLLRGIQPSSHRPDWQKKSRFLTFSRGKCVDRMAKIEPNSAGNETPAERKCPIDRKYRTQRNRDRWGESDAKRAIDRWLRWVCDIRLLRSARCLRSNSLKPSHEKCLWRSRNECMLHGKEPREITPNPFSHHD